MPPEIERKYDALPRWELAANGKVPPEAISGGKNGHEVLYVARVQHGECLLPGQLCPSDGVVHVSWHGKQYAYKEYEVLCGRTALWIPTRGKQRPDNALVAGKTEDGEELFVGRVSRNETLTVGKVQFFDGACYIVYQGKELRFEVFEVLVVK